MSIKKKQKNIQQDRAKNAITLDMVKPEDKVEGYPKDFPFVLRKLLESIPAIFIWFMVLSPLIFAFTKQPQILVYYVAFLSVYWAYKGVKFSVGLIIGYRRILRDAKINWMQKINSVPELKNKLEVLKFVYICPVVKEGLETLEPSFDLLAQNTIGAKRISIVLAIEERFKDIQLENFEKLKKKYGNKFREFLYYIHPGNIEGEVSGVKCANINWATRHFVKHILANGEKLTEYILSTSDCDQRVHPQYFAAIAYKYFTVPDPMHTFFSSAVHTFNNNIWRVPMLIRLQSQILTLGVLQEWTTAKKLRETYSAYLVNLQTVHDVGYWLPDIGNDDTVFYWYAKVKFDGNFKGEEVYLPTSNDAVENETFLKTHRSFYKQQHRWGWGGITFPTVTARLLQNKNINLMNKIDIILSIFYKQILFLTLIYVITLALPILNIISPEYNYSSYSYNLPKIISYILTSLLFLMIPTTYVRRKISPPPKDWPIWRHAWDMVEMFFTSINALTFSFIPYIQAYTEMMVGKGMRKNYYATEKVKMTKSRH